jgi:hypothetical protein
MRVEALFKLIPLAHDRQLTASAHASEPDFGGSKEITVRPANAKPATSAA